MDPKKLSRFAKGKSMRPQLGQLASKMKPKSNGLAALKGKKPSMGDEEDDTMDDGDAPPAKKVKGKAGDVHVHIHQHSDSGHDEPDGDEMPMSDDGEDMPNDNDHMADGMGDDMDMSDDTDNMETSRDDDAVAAQVAAQWAAGKQDSQILKLMQNYDPEMEDVPMWVANEDVWQRAMMAVDPEGMGGSYDDPYALVAAVYRKLGGKVKTSL